jgi:hypothetical protein
LDNILRQLKGAYFNVSPLFPIYHLINMNIQAIGDATKPATRPAAVKVSTPVTVGVLPGFL